MRFLKFNKLNLESLSGNILYTVGAKQSSSGALVLGSEYNVKIYIPSVLGACSGKVTVYDESCKNIITTYELSWDSLITGTDVVTFSINTSAMGIGLYFYQVSLDTLYGKVYCKLEFGRLLFLYSAPDKKIQFSISNFKYPLPNKILGGIIYHIFVDRFSKSENIAPKEGAVLVDNWDNGIPEYPAFSGAELKNNTFFGGSLFGIIDKLDYIKSLGANIIYLSPIFESPSNHKYDTADYMSVDKMFGGEEALKMLISRASELGIYIILDGVFNHTGADSIYFNKYGKYNELGAFQSKFSKYFDWYNFYDFPSKYESWWNIDILPRIKLRNKTCCEFFLKKNGVIDRYASLGIIGFRLDVADELPDEFIAGLKERISKRIKSSVVYGEVWEDASNKIAYGARKKYFLGEELDGVMNYPLRQGIIEYLIHNRTDILLYALTEVLDNAPERIRNIQMNILGSHDTERIITVLSGTDLNISNEEKHSKHLSFYERQLAIARLKLAYTILMTVPGIPTIFYADEAGLEGYSDPFNRMPFPWGKEDRDILGFIQKLGNIRRVNSVYRDGEFKILELTKDRLVFERKRNSTSLITVINNSENELCFSLSENSFGLLSRRRYKKGNKHTLPKISSEIIRISNEALFEIFD